MLFRLSTAVLTVVMALLFAVSLVIAPAGAAVIWAVGDGANLSNNSDSDVANMIVADNPDALLYLGDVYETGTADEFLNAYEPSFGQVKSKTFPTPGNHEWTNRDSGYFPYWASVIADNEYYSFDVGGWHFISLNSENGYESGSQQVNWLASDISANAGKCMLAYIHKPRFSAGSHGDQTQLEPLWNQLGGKVKVLLSGHDHNYQRLALSGGVTGFVVGTGGRSHYAVDPGYGALQAYDSTNYGALRMETTDGGLNYAFKAVDGSTLDSGTVACSRSGDGGGGDSSSLVHSVKTKKYQHRSKVFRSGFKLLLNCSSSCTVDVTITARNPRRKKSSGKVVADRTFTISGDGSISEKVRLKPGAARFLRQRGVVRLHLNSTATDALGNRVSATKLVVLK